MLSVLALAVVLQAPAPLIGDVPAPVVLSTPRGDFQAPPDVFPSKQQPQVVYPTAQGPPQVVYQAQGTPQVVYQATVTQATAAPCVDARQARRGLFGGHKAKKAARRAGRAPAHGRTTYSQTTYSRTTHQSVGAAPCSTCR